MGTFIATTIAVRIRDKVDIGVMYCSADNLYGTVNGIAKIAEIKIHVVRLGRDVAIAGTKSPRNTKYAITTPWPKSIVTRSRNGPANFELHAYANNLPYELIPVFAELNNSIRILMNARMEPRSKSKDPLIRPVILITYGKHRIPPPIAADINVNMLCRIPPAVRGPNDR